MPETIWNKLDRTVADIGITTGGTIAGGVARGSWNVGKNYLSGVFNKGRSFSTPKMFRKDYWAKSYAENTAGKTGLNLAHGVMRTAGQGALNALALPMEVAGNIAAPLAHAAGQQAILAAKSTPRFALGIASDLGRGALNTFSNGAMGVKDSSTIVRAAQAVEIAKMVAPIASAAYHAQTGEETVFQSVHSRQSENESQKRLTASASGLALSLQRIGGSFISGGR